jgi:hypothetical protein
LAYTTKVAHTHVLQASNLGLENKQLFPYDTIYPFPMPFLPEYNSMYW